LVRKPEAPLPGWRADYTDPLTAFLEHTAGRPVYVTGALHLAPQISDEVIAGFARQHPHVNFVNARGRYYSGDDWHRRWQQERNLYGGAIIITAGEMTDDNPSPCDDPSLPASRGFHAVGTSILIEIEDLTRLRRPILWHPVSPFRSALISRFAVEGLRRISYSHMARLVPASDAVPFLPVFCGHFLFGGRHGPDCSAGP
jgi:hypothetical protein